MARSILRVALLAAAAVGTLLAQQGFSSPAFGRTQMKGERVFFSPCSAIWAVGLLAFDSKGFDPLTLEKESGFARFTWREGALIAYGGAGKATRAFTRMRSGTLTRITNFEVEHATLLLRDSPKGCASSVRVVYRGFRQDIVGSRYWQRLASNGVMEDLLLDQIAEMYTPADVPAVEAAPPRPAAEEAQPDAPVSLDITSNPRGAEIWVDGKFAGSTPTRKTIAPGASVVEVRADGYRPWSRELEAGPGDEISIRADLERESPTRELSGGVVINGPK